ncbi:MAG: 4Fe-4S dicluster domain-containing protein [Deltaproteobacteria bacterium]|nr:4Fe-4S dicluster domain-containing protein [Deltaproteobacteria bacterium]MBW2176096.1 4Fe-4S dicluster domain-containing protein [Deltaproteobacteria bacterium]
MKFIHNKKGYDLHLTGNPSQQVSPRETPEFVALVPDKIPFVKPRLKVKQGSRVQLGSVIFEDKRNPEFKFLSPGGGRVAEIVFGPRRVIQQVVVQLDRDEQHESFLSCTESQLDSMSRTSLVDAILKGGLWCLFREFPFGDIPRPEVQPPSIIVSLDSREPFQPDPAIYLADRVDLLAFGVKILRKLSDEVHVSLHQDNEAIAGQLKGVLTHRVSGPYPTGDAGVLLYRTKQHPHENKAWYISGQDLLLLAELIKTGKYPVERTVVLAGSLAHEKLHIRTRMGAPLKFISGETSQSPEHSRYIVGGIFRGYAAEKESFLDLYATSLTILPEGDKKELFGFARPGLKKPTRSRTFLSSLKTSPFEVDCGLHGEKRACINCGYCDDVCAVDILPQFALKSTLTGEVEESLAHGLLDCVNCGLCTFVCPSKIDICAILRQAKNEYYKEIS